MTAQTLEVTPSQTLEVAPSSNGSLVDMRLVYREAVSSAAASVDPSMPEHLRPYWAREASFYRLDCLEWIF